MLLKYQKKGWRLNNSVYTPNSTMGQPTTYAKAVQPGSVNFGRISIIVLECPGELGYPLLEVCYDKDKDLKTCFLDDTTRRFLKCTIIYDLILKSLHRKLRIKVQRLF